MRKLVIILSAMLIAPFLLGIDHGDNSPSPPPSAYEHSEHLSQYLSELEFVFKVIYSNLQVVAVTSIKESTIEHKPSYSEEDLDLLSRIVSAEAKGEPVEGQIAVANVVLNRVASEEFPDSIEEVIYQKGQFSPVKNGTIDSEPTQEAIESARRALEGEVVVGSDVFYFYNPKTAKSKWNYSRETAVAIGNHNFSY